MNLQDYKLIPLDEIASDAALKASYIEMMRALFKEYWSDGKKGRYILNDVAGSLDFDDIEGAFGWYLDYIHLRGTRARDNKYDRTQICALVHTASRIVVGEAGFYIEPKDYKIVCTGYDAIRPDLRGKGLGKVIMALRLEAAARVFSAENIIFFADNDNEASLRRLARLRQAGLITKSYPKSSGKDYIVPLNPSRTAADYMRILGSTEGQFDNTPAGP